MRVIGTPLVTWLVRRGPGRGNRALRERCLRNTRSTVATLILVKWLSTSAESTKTPKVATCLILYPSLRVKFPQGKREVVGDVPPGAFRPVDMKAENL
jgi:hypothetical protein